MQHNVIVSLGHDGYHLDCSCTWNPGPVAKSELESVLTDHLGTTDS